MTMTGQPADREVDRARPADRARDRGDPRRRRRRPGAVPEGDRRRVPRRGAARRADPDRARRPRPRPAAGRRGGPRGRPLLRVLGDDPGDAPHPGGLPGAARLGRGCVDYVRRIAAEQLLLASATTEIGIGGNTRNSSCFVEYDGARRFRLVKQAPVISYGEYADAIVATARRAEDSPPSDQVLVVCESPAVSLSPLSGWDTLGFRGTCSLGFTLEASGDATLVLDVPFGDISSQTMLPTSHLLWSSLWLGLAEEASWRAQRFVQKAARKDPGTMPPGATRLAALMITRQQFASSIEALMTRYLEIWTSPTRPARSTSWSRSTRSRSRRPPWSSTWSTRRC